MKNNTPRTVCGSTLSLPFDVNYIPVAKKWAFEFTLIIIDIKRFLTQGSENIKLYSGYAGYSKRFGVLHHHQLNMIDLYEALVEVIYRRIRWYIWCSIWCEGISQAYIEVETGRLLVKRITIEGSVGCVRCDGVECNFDLWLLECRIMNLVSGWRVYNVWGLIMLW